jgi:hypothetical protein
MSEIMQDSTVEEQNCLRRTKPHTSPILLLSRRQGSVIHRVLMEVTRNWTFRTKPSDRAVGCSVFAYNYMNIDMQGTRTEERALLNKAHSPPGMSSPIRRR